MIAVHYTHHNTPRLLLHLISSRDRGERSDSRSCDDWPPAHLSWRVWAGGRGTSYRQCIQEGVKPGVEKALHPGSRHP